MNIKSRYAENLFQIGIWCFFCILFLFPIFIHAQQNLSNNYAYPLNQQALNHIQLTWSQQLLEPLSKEIGYQNHIFFFITKNFQKLYALSETTGEILWHIETDEKWAVAPTLFKGNIYIPSYDTGILYGYEQETGTLIHSIPMNERVVFPVIFYQSYLLILTQDNYLQSYLFPSMDAFQQIHTRFQYPVTFMPTLFRNTIYISTRQNQLFSLDLDTREENWHITVPEPIVSPIVTDGDYVYVLTTQKIFKLSAENGMITWQIWHGYDDTYLAQGVQLISRGDTIYLPERGFDKESGMLSYTVWGRGEGLGKHIIVGDYQIVFRYGYFEPATLFVQAYPLGLPYQGQILTRIQYPNSEINSLTYGNNKVILTGPNSTIYALDLQFSPMD